MATARPRSTAKRARAILAMRKGLVQTGPEYLVKLDGRTGRILAKTAWLSREGYPDYNYYCRNFLTVAYLDGKTPVADHAAGHVQRDQDAGVGQGLRHASGTGRPGRRRAKYAGQGSHGLIAADVDNDGRDELVIGAAVLDDTGKGLWTLEMGHPDICYVARRRSGEPRPRDLLRIRSETSDGRHVRCRRRDRAQALDPQGAHVPSSRPGHGRRRSRGASGHGGPCRRAGLSRSDGSTAPPAN